MDILRLVGIGLISFTLLVPSASAILVGEEDGDPNHLANAAWALKFANGNLTCTAGVCSVADQGGAGSGDNVTVGGTAVDTTANFADNIYHDYIITDGGAGGPDAVTSKPLYGNTLAGDPAFSVDECNLFADTAGGGLLCEGSTANGNEQLYRMPDNDAADRTAYFMVQYGRHVNGKDYGMVCDGSTDDATALQAAIDALGTTALGTANYPNVNGGTTNISGGVVHIPGGICLVKSSITLRPWVVLQGEGRWTSIIRGDQSELGGTPVIDATGAGWIIIRDLALETDATASAGEHLLNLDRNGINFGNKFVIERVNFYRGYNAIESVGSSTGSAIRDVYIRAPAEMCIHQDSSAGWGAVSLNNVYCSNTGSHGIQLEGGLGSSTWNNVITETTTGDGLQITGAARNVFNGLYLGDDIGNGDDGSAVAVGLHLIGSKVNTFNGLIVDMDPNARGSVIKLDGSTANTFNEVYLTSSGYRYTIEWVNDFGANTDVLSRNTFRNVHRSNMSCLGLLNDDTYVNFEGESKLQLSTTTISGSPVTTLFKFLTDEVLTDEYTFKSIDVPTYTGVINYPAPTGQERWSFLRDWSGVDSYSLMNRAGGTLGVLPATESLGDALITGDDSDMDTIGNWTATNDTITSEAGGETGNGLQVEIDAAVSQSSGYLEVSGLTSGKLYRIDFDVKVTSAASTFRFFLEVYGSVAFNTRLARAEYFNNTNAYVGRTVYFVANHTAARIYLTHTQSVTIGDTIMFDNFEMKEVKSGSSFKFSGGRKYGDVVGGGAGLQLYGKDHASKPSIFEATGDILPSADNTYDIGASGTEFTDGWFDGWLSSASGLRHTGDLDTGVNFGDNTINLKAGNVNTHSVTATASTVLTGKNFGIGAVVWNSGDSIDGEKIADDTIDDDSIDFGDVTLADLTDDVGYEEETHASEHLADAADEIFIESLGTACTVGQVAASDGDGTVSCAAAGGAPAWDDLTAPDNNGLTTITFDNAETTLLTGDNDAAASFFTIRNTDADHTGGNLYLLDLDYSADDGDVDADFIKCQDSGSVVWKVEQDGDTTIGGGASGSIDFGTNTLDDDAVGNLLKGWINLPVQSAKLTGAYITTGGAAIDAGDGNWRLLFDTTTDEEAVWGFRMPNDYDNGLVAKIGYTMTSATSSTVGMEVSVMAVTDGDSVDVGTGSFDTDNDVAGGTTVPGTAGYLDEISISLANDDSVAAGDFVYIHLLRDVDDDDAAAGDCEVVYFQLEYNRT